MPGQNRIEECLLFCSVRLSEAASNLPQVYTGEHSKAPACLASRKRSGSAGETICRQEIIKARHHRNGAERFGQSLAFGLWYSRRSSTVYFLPVRLERPIAS